MHPVKHLVFVDGIGGTENVSCALSHLIILVNLWDVVKPHILNHSHFLKSRLF